MSVTGDLCQRIVATESAEVGAEAFAAARRLVLDGLAVGVAGSREEAVGLLVRHHLRQGTAPLATVVGLGRSSRTGPVAAAAINGAAMHVLDFEPMWSPANHALSTTLPAVLALAELQPISGRELLTALVKGVEMQGWLRQASHQWEAKDLLFHPPGVVGPLGAAVAAGHLLRLDARRLAHALGIAASRSGGLMGNVGTMTKCLHCGQAAAGGLEAALLAEAGFTANPAILDDPRGLPAAFSPAFDVAELGGFGPPFRLVEPGYVLKMFPCQYGTHFGISAGIALHRRLDNPRQLLRDAKAVRLVAPVMAYVDRPLPATGLDGKFSLQYTLAAALLDGDVTRATFRDERLADQALRDLLAKVTLTLSPDIPGRFEEMHVVVEVDLADGRTLTERCDGPAGIWGSAPIPESTHRAKVVDCFAPTLSGATIDRLIDLTSRLDALDAAGVGELVGLAGA